MLTTPRVDPPDADRVYALYLETCRRLGVEAVPRERAQALSTARAIERRLKKRESRLRVGYGPSLRGDERLLRRVSGRIAAVRELALSAMNGNSYSGASFSLADIRHGKSRFFTDFLRLRPAAGP